MQFVHPPKRVFAKEHLLVLAHPRNVSRERERERERDGMGQCVQREGGGEREMQYDIAVGALDAAHEQASTEVRLHQQHIPCVYPPPLSTCMYSPPEVRLRQGHIKGTSRTHST
jgi:hypothetical protein